MWLIRRKADRALCESLRSLFEEMLPLRLLVSLERVQVHYLRMAAAAWHTMGPMLVACWMFAVL